MFLMELHNKMFEMMFENGYGTRLSRIIATGHISMNNVPSVIIFDLRVEEI